MFKSLAWIGVVLSLIGLAVVAASMFSAPQPVAETPLATIDPSARSWVTPIAGGLTLVGGLVLIGIGVGRWSRPSRVEPGAYPPDLVPPSDTKSS